MEMNVLVTGVGGGGHGEQILKALRLSTIKYRIIGTDMSPISKGLVNVDIPYLLPPANDPSYTDKLLELCKKHDVKAVFHGSEPELKVMNANREKIEAAGLFLPINPSNVIDICMDKFKTVQFLKDNGFRFPLSARITSKEDLEKVDFMPVVLKPSVGGGGSANLMLAQTREELQVFGQYLLTIYSEFIVQEYVGTPDNEFTVGVLSSMTGELINSIAVKRMILTSLSNRIKAPNRTGKPELGKILAISSGVSQGEIGRFSEVTKPCEHMANVLGSTGAINIQCRFVNGEVYVFEINPRFSGTTSLRAMVGYNEPDILIRKHILGEDVKPFFDYKTGYILRGLEESYINTLDIPSI
jgi:carbamoyl-phosphate synthase large subunit